MIPLLLLALSAPAQAATAQALVELRPEGARLIDLVASPGPLSGRSLPPLEGGPLLELLDAEGAVLARVPLPDARGRSVLPLGDARPGQEVVLDRAVLRVPLDWPEGAVALRLGTQRLSPRLPPPLDPVAVQDSGPSTERLDLVILGDGYREAELGRFAEDVDRMSAYLLGIEPYGAYRDLFNIWRIDRASAESGVSHYDAGRDEDRDTAYGCYYGCAGIDRLVCCDDGKVMTEVAEAVPGADGVLVLINDPTYGGAGGYQYATSYTEGRTGEQVAAHELGHSLVGLGDEYSYGVPSSATPRNNCTLDADDPPWSAWLDEPGVSAFPVCGYTNQHRPTDSSCMMRSLRDDYCVVCREQAVLAIYGALPRLIGSLSPEAGEVARVPGESLRFSAEVLGESSARFAWAWLLDGERISSDPELVLEGCRGGLLELRLQDPTAWVRSDPDGLLQDAAAWTLLPCPDGDPDDSGDSGDRGPGGTGDPGLTPPIDREAPAACACGSGGPAGAMALPLLVLGLLRRRRAPLSAAQPDR